MSERVWDLSGVQGAGEWVLLDFPGLGAAESGVRDGFLCKRELREVQTILILLDGRRPGGEGGQTIFSMLHADRPGQDLRDSILVVVNRFDQLPIQAAVSAVMAAPKISGGGCGRVKSFACWALISPSKSTVSPAHSRRITATASCRR